LIETDPTPFGGIPGEELAEVWEQLDDEDHESIVSFVRMLLGLKQK